MRRPWTRTLALVACRPSPRRLVSSARPSPVARALGRSSDSRALRSSPIAFLPVIASQAQAPSAPLMTFVLDYRCGAVPDSHRVPFSARGVASRRAPIASDRILRRIERVNRSARVTLRARCSLDAARTVRSSLRACVRPRPRSSSRSTRSLHFFRSTHRRGVTPRSSRSHCHASLRFATSSLTELHGACYGTACHMPSVPVD